MSMTNSFSSSLNGFRVRPFTFGTLCLSGILVNSGIWSDHPCMSSSLRTMVRRDSANVTNTRCITDLLLPSALDTYMGPGLVVLESQGRCCLNQQDQCHAVMRDIVVPFMRVTVEVSAHVVHRGERI
jgi:hypothetical protein